MTNMSINVGKILSYFNRANIGTAQDARGRRDKQLSTTEIQNRIATLQTNPVKNKEELDFWQNMMTGNDGNSFYNLAANLDKQAGLSKIDLLKLTTLGHNLDRKNKLDKLDNNDFQALKQGYTSSGIPICDTHPWINYSGILI